MNIIIRKTGNKSPIFRAGNTEYKKIKDWQEIIEIDNSQWIGKRKSEIHYDRIQNKIINNPYPLTPEEQLEKDKQDRITILKNELWDVFVNIDNYSSFSQFKQAILDIYRVKKKK